MYAELFTIKVEPEQIEAVGKMIPPFSALHESNKGFVNQAYLLNGETGEAVCYTVWETKEDRQNNYDICLPEFQKAAADLIKEAPVIKFFDVAHTSQK